MEARPGNRARGQPVTQRAVLQQLRMRVSKWRAWCQAKLAGMLGALGHLGQ